MAKSLRYANGGNIGVGQYVAVASASSACNPNSTEKPEIQEIANKLKEEMKFQESELDIEVVDDTALINTSLIAKGRKLNKNQYCHQETKINGKKKAQRNHRKEYYWIKKKKIVVHAYSRAEMLSLSCQDTEYQLNKWTAVYRGLAASVAAEYDGLVASAAVGNKPPGFYYDRRPLLEKPPHNFEALNAMVKRSPLKIFLH